MLDGFENTEWRQGHVLSSADVQRLFPNRSDSEGLIAVVTSHDCDLARDPSVEPSVEIVFGKVVKNLDGNLTHAKNSRKLHVPLTEASDHLFVELLATDKSTFDKNELLTSTPDLSKRLAKDELIILQSWLAARYRRSAFPNEFNNRLSTAKIPKEISKKLESLGEIVCGLYFDLQNDQELADQRQTYKLGIYILYVDNGDEDRFSRVEKLVNDIKAIFENAFHNKQLKVWGGVELIECTEVSDHAMSVALIGKLKRWNADYISLRANPQQALL